MAMQSNLIIKIASWVGIVLIGIVVLTGTFKAAYILETLGLAYALLFAYGHVKNKIILQVTSIFFMVDYSFLNYSIPDLIIWGAIALGVFKEYLDK